ncbi:hypothetical protein TNCV_3632871 [Trichonephila clavipes]|nr:hypothetical protein TNCV_3632871 [Trichonephila clavipes]
MEIIELFHGTSLLLKRTPWWLKESVPDLIEKENWFSKRPNLNPLNYELWVVLKSSGFKSRMDRTTKRDINAQPIGTRRKGRPNLRWIDGLEMDL